MIQTVGGLAILFYPPNVPKARRASSLSAATEKASCGLAYHAIAASIPAMTSHASRRLAAFVDIQPSHPLAQNVLLVGAGVQQAQDPVLGVLRCHE
jgi:hypothetical protein